MLCQLLPFSIRIVPIPPLSPREISRFVAAPAYYFFLCGLGLAYASPFSRRQGGTMALRDYGGN
jgi:hypothetical protein